MTKKYTIEMLMRNVDSSIESWLPVSVTPDGAMSTFEPEQMGQALAYWTHNFPQDKFRGVEWSKTGELNP